MIDLNNNLILVKGLDKTDAISRWDYESGHILITYTQGARPYRYNSGNVQFYKNPKELSSTDYLILNNGQALGNVVRIQQFEQHVRVFYRNGFHEIFDRKSIVLMPSCLRKETANDRFTYFRELAHVDTLLGPDGMPILGKRFDKIDFVRDDSILSAFLLGSIPDNHIPANPTLYYPFGFNASQKQAVDQALNNRISVIEGPPGTGKTQTILNIIANIVMRGESVAVVSSNNSATKNVEEKLKKYGVDFISAFLGSTENKGAFILNQKKVPNTSTWKLERDELQKTQDTLPELNRSLCDKLQKKNKLSELRLELDAFKIEKAYFLEYFEETNVGSINFKTVRQLSSSALLKLMAQCELQQDCSTSIPIIMKLINFFRFGIYNSRFYKNSIERIVAICQKRFYDVRMYELEKQIKALERDLSSYRFDEKMQSYSELSMKMFRNRLAQKYERWIRQEYCGDDLWKQSESFIKDYPVILSTTHSLRSSLSNQYVYDYVIVDEASQVSVTTGVLAFSCAKRAVIVGDLKQLPNVVDGEMKRRTDELFTQYDLPEAYRYSNHSLLLAISELFKDVPRVMLREHYRCNPKIINFCNQKFYNNQLIVLTKDEEETKPLMVYKTAPGNHAREHLNQRQIDIIREEVIPQQRLEAKKQSIGIVTPYRNQANAMQATFSDVGINADTVDKYQGQERDIIILSTVDNDISDFADDDHRLNVAISRAMKQLIVVTTGNTSTRETGIGDLINYIQYNNMDVINSEIYSVFDLLYKQYAAARLEMLSRQKRVSEYDSENLMYKVIMDVFMEENLSKYGVLLHVPLRMILRDLSKLNTDRESQFVMNENTHVDFLIFDKLSHQPVLVVEVDGSKFHREGSPQAERDKLKNIICGRYNLPLERFSTTGSNEKERFSSALKRIADI